MPSHTVDTVVSVPRLRLKGQNFQPWADFILDVDKLTVIVGPSNKGKSALFRALKGVLRNELPAAFVREKHDPLELELAVDGHIIKAVRKRKGSTKYEIDGEPYTSLGGKLPDVVTNMKFGEVKIGDTVIDPIFAPQNKAQFLIDPDSYKPSDINAVLGAFASTEKLDKGKKEANLRISQKNSEARTIAEEVREAEARKAELQLLTFKGIPVKVALEDLEREIKQVETKYGWSLLALKHRQRVVPLREIEKSLTLPDLTQAQVMSQQVHHAEIALGALRKVRVLGKVTVIDDTTTAWSDIVRTFKQQKVVSELIEMLSHKDDTLTKLCNNLNGTISKLNEHIEDARDYADSITYAEQARRTLITVVVGRNALETREQELSTAQEEVTALMQEAAEAALKAKQAAEAKKLCPKCGKPMEHICG